MLPILPNRKRFVFVFLDWPEPGAVLPGLSRDLDPETAANVYQVVVEDLVGRLRRLEAIEGWRFLLMARPVTKLREVVLWLNDGTPPVLDALPQPEQPFGERLEHAAGWGFDRLGAEEVYLLQSGLLDFEPEALRQAAHLLRNQEAAIGRTSGGAAYLAALRRPLPGALAFAVHNDGRAAETLAQCLGERGAATDTEALPVLEEPGSAAALQALAADTRQRLGQIAAARGFSIPHLS